LGVKINGTRREDRGFKKGLRQCIYEIINAKIKGMNEENQS